MQIKTLVCCSEILHPPPPENGVQLHLGGRRARTPEKVGRKFILLPSPYIPQT